MSFNAEKMANIIRSECNSIEERCNGYKKKVIDAIIEILKAEKEHKGQRTNIQQQVDDVCYSAGDFLLDQRDVNNSTIEDIQ